MSGRRTDAALACIILAHNDATHVRRLVDALDPFPIYLHCDARTSEPTFQAMTHRLPDRVRLLKRQATPWASWGLVGAELAGYRAWLADGRSGHVAVLSGSDYPVASSAAITATLQRHAGFSLAESRMLPIPAWGRDGGYWRFRYAFRPWRKRALLLPIPRPLPSGISLAGGSQFKILAHRHVAALVAAVDAHPHLIARFRRTWVPDETFVHSLLNTAAFVPSFRSELIPHSPWFTNWQNAGRTKSPSWLTCDDLAEIRAASDQRWDHPVLFARKFSSAINQPVVDELDKLREATLR